jgi:uncharacterized cupredoxin-like copper-binding protein
MRIDRAKGLAVVVGTFAFWGCSSDTTTTSPAGSATSAPEGTVPVTVQEFAVIPATTSAPAGDVTFAVTNKGPEDTHEFVVISTDLAPQDLPTEANGSVDEKGKGIEPVDEIEDIAVGTTESLTTELEAGSYVLVCNIYDQDEQEAHYEQGMYTSFTVT